MSPGAWAWAAAAGALFFLAAWLAIPLTTPEGVGQFWPAAGIAVGFLIISSRTASWPVAAAIAVASVLANALAGRSAPACYAFALGNTGEALLVAALVDHWFPQPFELDRFRNVLGLFGVAALGTVASQAVMALMLELSGHTAAPLVFLWSRLVWASMTGIVMVAPVLLGLAASARKPLSWREVVEGTAVLAFHTIASAHAFALLPLELGRWMLLAPFTSQLPLLLWLSVRCGPLFASAGSLVLGLSILGSFTLERGRFADANFLLHERLAATDFAMLATAFVALAIAALIAERKDAELAASQSRARLKLSLDAGKLGLWELDPKTRLFDAASDIVGENISILMTGPHRTAHDAYISAYRRTGNAKIIGIGREVEGRRKDGSTFAVDLAIAEWQVAGKRYFTGIIRDISERKRQEQKVALLLREVNHRAKNMLALVQAIASQTAVPPGGEFVERFLRAAFGTGSQPGSPGHERLAGGQCPQARVFATLTFSRAYR